jgi:glutamine synthetase
MLKAGLHGIRDEMPLPPPVEESLFAMDAAELQRRHISTIPGTLGEALESLRRDPVVQEALGEPLYTKFLEAKAREWEDYRRYVTPWEIERYLGVW